MRCLAKVWVSVLILITLVGCSRQPSVPQSQWGAASDKIYAYFMRWEGTPYRLGGADRRGVDCSAFVQNLYAEVFARDLPRTTDSQSGAGAKVAQHELLPGDLVFFKTGWRTRHVGVYLGEGQFVHASTSRGVMRSSLLNPYWSEAYWQARRIH